MSGEYPSFSKFYPFYLSEHQDRNCRRMHFLGTSAGVICLAAVVLTGNLWFILVGLTAGYACAWVGHFFFEHNRPATFTHPVYSFIGDWVMFKDILIGRVKI